MPEARKPTIVGRRLLKALAQIARIYWSSPDARWGALLLALTIVLELGAVYTRISSSRTRSVTFWMPWSRGRRRRSSRPLGCFSP